MDFNRYIALDSDNTYEFALLDDDADLVAGATITARLYSPEGEDLGAAGVVTGSEGTYKVPLPPSVCTGDPAAGYRLRLTIAAAGKTRVRDVILYAGYEGPE